ncbi:hypothetical protein GCM10010300_77320 [Streptomyces olivaceoviridis]|uniref:hypothetical protein n=1 Tax=Streptomyces olivaceoviridis TaxID=1921 RepID=UPI00167464C8|nr:hypothetical protein [Streptomyces olivaceoviridis]GGZ22121.1 hypothetical protein GCM10010300_77320 [Streptomyces olivaceoviridis]
MARRISKAKSIDTRTEEEQQQDRARRLRYGGPWAITALGPVLVEGAHVAVSGNPAALALATLGIAGTGAALCKFLGHLDSKAKRDKDTVRLHQVNSVAVTAAATLGTITGLDTAATASTWAIGGVGLALANNLWSSFHKKGSEKGASRWEKLEAEIGLAKHELKEAKSNGKGTVIATVEGKDGATADELARRIPAMASALKLGKGRITHTVDDDDSSLITMRVQVADLLKEGFPWRGPSAFGASIGDVPIRTGRYEDGEDLLLNLTGQLRDPGPLSNGNVEHAIAMGVNGAGKTQGNQLIITECCTRTEVSVIVIDCSKFQQDFGHVRHGIEWPIDKKDAARRFFKILPTAIEKRTDFLAAKGLSKWEPGCGLNFLVVIGEEAADFAADNEHYQKILRTARAAGIWILTSIQRATHNNMDTDSRANSPAGLCFGLRDGADAQYCLPDEAIDAGAWPQWGNRKPGYHYAAGLGIPEERWHVTARTELASKRDQADAVTAGAAIRTPLDTITAEAFGDLYVNRTTYDAPLLPKEEGEDNTVQQAAPSPSPAAPPASPAVEASPAYSGPPDEEMDDVDEETMAAEVEELNEMLKNVLDEDPEPGQYDHLRIEDEIEPPAEDTPVFSLPSLVEEGDRMSPEECKSAIFARLDKWLREGKASFEPKELNDLWMRVDLEGQRSWWNRLRKQLLDDGVISKDDSDEGYGRYDLMRSPLSDSN